MLDRREFLGAGMMTALAAAGYAEQAGRSAAAGNGTTLSLTFKGQAAFLTPKAGSTVGTVSVCCLKTHPGDVAHDGWLFLPRANVNLDGSVQPTETNIAGWWGWALKGRIALKNAVVVPLLKKAVLAARTAVPDPVNNEDSWKDAAWIPDSTIISPGSDLIPKWENECEWILTLPKGAFTGRKPCKTRDTGAVWAWPYASGLHDLRAATDMVVYDSMAFTGTAQITMSGDVATATAGVINLVGGVAQGYVLCSPPHKNASPNVYKPGDKLDHFRRFYRILTNPSNAEMTYAFASAPMNTLTIGNCPPPVTQKDDDIFCPGMHMPLLK